jgi:hypothetical protein
MAEAASNGRQGCQNPPNAQKRSHELDHDLEDGETDTKRFKSDGNGTSNKAARNSGTQGDSGRNSTLLPTPSPQLSAPLQCGFYGIELMRSSWDRTHSIVILLEGESSFIYESLS